MEYKLATVRLAKIKDSNPIVAKAESGKLTLYRRNLHRDSKCYHLCWTVDVPAMYIGLWYLIDGEIVLAKKASKVAGLLVLASTDKMIDLPRFNTKYIGQYLLYQKLEMLVGYVEGLLDVCRAVPKTIYTTYLSEFGDYEGYHVDRNNSLEMYDIKSTFKAEEVRSIIKLALNLGALLGDKLTEEVESSFIKNNIYLD